MTLQSMAPAIGGLIFGVFGWLYALHTRNSVRKARAADRKPAE
jgi:hypothetical protein